MPEWEPIEVEPTDRTFVTEDGRVFRDSLLNISPTQAQMLHQGYLCAKCLEDLTSVGAFPERCPLCKFEVARFQRQMLEEQYRGADTSIIPAGFPIEREREHLERAEYRPKGLVTMSVPKKRRK